MTIYTVLLNKKHDYKFVNTDEKNSSDIISDLLTQDYKIYEKYLGASNEKDAKKQILKIRAKKMDFPSYNSIFSKVIRLIRSFCLFFSWMIFINFILDITLLVILNTQYSLDNIKLNIPFLSFHWGIGVSSLLCLSIIAFVMGKAHSIIFKEPACVGLGFKRIFKFCLILKIIIFISTYLNTKSDLRREEIFKLTSNETKHAVNKNDSGVNVFHSYEILKEHHIKKIDDDIANKISLIAKENLEKNFKTFYKEEGYSIKYSPKITYTTAVLNSNKGKVVVTNLHMTSITTDGTKHDKLIQFSGIRNKNLHRVFCVPNGDNINPKSAKCIKKVNEVFGIVPS